MLALIDKFLCPICNVELGPWSRGITLHARSHGLTSQDVYDLVKKITNRPNCTCKEGCNASVKWQGWELGYAQYARGHYDAKTRSKKTSAAMVKRWSNCNDSSPMTAISSQKISKTLRDGFISGRIKHWAQGQTKETHPAIASRSELMKGSKHRRYKSTVLYDMLLDRFKDRFTLLTTIEELTQRKSNRSCTIQAKCNRCDTELALSAYNIIRKEQQFCPNCDRWASKFETDIGDFIESLGFKIERRTAIEGQEIDIFVKEHHFGIECNGLYWHCDAVQSNKYHHQNKTLTCLNLGFNLFHIFEDEWRDKRSIVEGMIKSRLKLTTKLGARSCVVRELDVKERRQFFEQNHIDGDTKATICFCLSIDDKIVAALSLRKPIQRKEKTLEVARFATLVGTTVVGALGKLIATAKKWAKMSGFERLMTYVDTRYGDGHSYETVGFVLKHVTAPRFWWTDTIHRFDRMTYRSRDGIPEVTIAKQNRVHKIYGCANKVYYLNTHT